MNRLYNLASHNQSSFALILVFIIVALFITILIVAVVTLIAVKKKPKIKLPPSALASNVKSNITNSIKKNIKSSPFIWCFSTRINSFLVKKGYIKANQIVRSFLNANNYLKNTLGVKNKYMLPWFMIIGPANSGKSSLLEGFTHDELYENNKEDDPCTWWFLKNGIVFDIKGDAFITPQGTGSDTLSWNTILHVLRRYRGEKPINGIILTIPATELYGKTKFPLDELKKRAQYMSEKLGFLQFYFGMRLPVYIVITKTDIIPGFQSFCAELPVRNRGNMLGWSVPFSLDTVYVPSMLDQAFEDLENSLNEIRLEIFSENLISSMKDAVFVFPSELLTIKESLSCFINTLFKGFADKDTSYFRGFYFTGDSRMVPLSKITDTNSDEMATIGTPDANINEVGTVTLNAEQLGPRKIFFFEDLLLKKIFLEDTVAMPMRVKIHQADKSVFIAKIITAAFVILGTYGLFSAKDKLNNSKNNLYPSLFKLSSVIKESGNLNYKTLDASGNEILIECSNQLLELMHQINNVRLYSLFVPSSWFSSLNKDLKNTLKTSYQKVIIRTIYINLLLRAKELLKLQKLEKSETLTELLNPESSKEYKQLKKYVFDLFNLRNYIRKFDTLCTSADPKDLNDLIKYTFNSELPHEFLKNYKEFRMILIDTPLPPLDLTPHIQVAQKITMQLFNNFISNIFEDDNTTFLNSFNNFINRLSRQNIKDFPNCKELRRFSNSLTSACIQMGQEGNTWLDKSDYEHSNDYKKLLDTIELIFGNKITDQMNIEISEAFKHLKIQIQSFNRLFIKPLNDTNTSLNNLNNISSNDTQLSKPIFKLEHSLNLLCHEGFMESPAEYELITEIPDGKMIFWDDELVNYAINIGHKYEEFASSYINEFPKCVQEGINLVVKTNLYAVLYGLIAKSQSLVDVPSGLTDLITAEEVLQRQVAELKGIAPKFLKLLKILRGDQFSFVFGNLRSLLNRIGFELLSYVDKLLENRQPYMPTNLNFDFWNGKIGASFVTYAAEDKEELDMYIQLQRSLISRIAIDFAKTIVDFLNSEYVYDENYGSHSQLTKWVRIVNDVEAFQKKEPNNIIKTLEYFIQTTLNSYTIDNITDKISFKELSKDTGDYFLNIIRNIKKGMMARAEILIRQRNIIRYEQLRNYYTRYLEPFYPFTNYDYAKRVDKDAALDNVKEFFQIYDEFGGSPESILDQIYQLEEGKEIYNFLKQIHVFREFLGDPFIKYNDTFKIKLEANFDINKTEEAHTDYLVDRIFVPTTGAHIEAINKDKISNWYFSDPISINFRWAEGDTSAQKPRLIPGDPDLTINQKIAQIECIGPWALLRFLQKYQTHSSKAKKTNSNQILLGFKVPLNDNTISKMYLGITLYKPEMTEAAIPTSISVPTCPGKMPKMPESVIALSNTAILTSHAIMDLPETNLSKTNFEKHLEKPSVKAASKTKKSKNKSGKNKSGTDKSGTDKSGTDKSGADKSAKNSVSQIEQINTVLNSSNPPELTDKVIAISEQPIG